MTELQPKLPDAQDLLEQIRFDNEEGKIWLDEQRMLLIHSAVMGLLRNELIQTLGVERAKGFLMRFGYHTGWRDAELAKKVRPDMTAEEVFMVGPQLHAIKGMVKVIPRSLEFDEDSQHFYGAFDWYNSHEVETHLASSGNSDVPVCWTLLGYASGFSTYYMNRQIIFRETQCAATGADHCHIEGRPAEDWDDAEETEKYLLPDPIIEQLLALQDEVSVLKDQFRSNDAEEDLLFNSVGHSAAFKNVCHLIRKASKSKVSVLLQGETGVGKEVVARGLHTTSDRANQPFVAVNCACIPPDLIEAELFGVEKGAYTGAIQSREGKFERAHRGTIFLDEVIELTPRAQASLLRVLQESEFERVGDNRTRRIDVRVVAATNEDLETAVQEGRFRADLFYRLNVYPVHIPPLRDRTEDIPLLTEHFLKKYCTLYNKKTSGISDKAMQALIQYKWPGNIRELENMIERGVILTENNQSISMSSFFPSLSEPSHPLNIIGGRGQLCEEAPKSSLTTTEPVESLLVDNFSLEQLEQKLIEEAMSRCNNNVSKAARKLGLTRPALAYRLKKLGDG
ncbi:DNA-binding transcriptional response regulator, NtrC family, contains REC, AAA-type ATPase, and a Fis-type DNA-binding domains [Amphritea atlantica]|uniref:DNA-binding transcriptional response regulator, NtrC family, contains REC, AAA-type ATPase, and a Fis-type DNA-binding domains n=1 Tax=Amphritea atlantica TaxID=355243 RepID=A0A1H9M398_9GAMM|nr:sigma-54-dependent Fis family transcriptional regulator [Amphritea atlantica]SER18126.1 DNA-binding transcriptional response regulator, NtrC family, contains REC, AAA-type ATPase, and a Fis-type DNA-binding domains [Amphritea atlantica]